VQKNLSRTLLHVYMINPLATIFQQFRHAMINHATPSSGTLLGSMAGVLEPVALVVVVFLVGFFVFNRTAPRVAEDL
jgi:ABC-2 type transport system permease protein